MIRVNGVKKNGVWSIKASKGGVCCDMDKVIDLQSYIAMIPNFLKSHSHA